MQISHYGLSPQRLQTKALACMSREGKRKSTPCALQFSTNTLFGSSWWCIRGSATAPKWLSHSARILHQTILRSDRVKDYNAVGTSPYPGILKADPHVLKPRQAFRTNA